MWMISHISGVFKTLKRWATCVPSSRCWHALRRHSAALPGYAQALSHSLAGRPMWIWIQYLYSVHRLEACWLCRKHWAQVVRINRTMLYSRLARTRGNDSKRCKTTKEQVGSASLELVASLCCPVPLCIYHCSTRSLPRCAAC